MPAMSQRLDDVTGKELPRLSAQQREQQRASMAEQVLALTRQMIVITRAVSALNDGQAYLDDGEKPPLWLAIDTATEELLRIRNTDMQTYEARLSAIEARLAWLSRPSWVDRLWARWR